MQITVLAKVCFPIINAPMTSPRNGFTELCRIVMALFQNDSNHAMSQASSPVRRPARGRRGWVIVLLLGVIAAAVFAWFGRPSTTPGGSPGVPSGAPSGAAPPAAPAGSGFGRGAGGRAMPVSAGTVQQRDVRVIQSAIGTIQALNTATVRVRVEGELRAIHFTEGQAVTAGQLLAEIDPRSFEVQLAQAEGQLARDQAQWANAQIDLARYRDLAARDSIARQQVDTQEALVKQLAGTIRINQANVDSARLMLSYTRVTAPISGQIGLRQVDLGNVVRPGDAQGLVTINQTQPISVVFSIPESALPKLRAGLRGSERPAVEAWDREQRNRLATGTVSSIDNAIDSATGTLRVKAQFENRDGSLFPNQFVNIRLQLDRLPSATVVPTAALQRGTGGHFVYRVGDDATVSIRTVEVTATEGDWTAVRGSITAGERVVTDGADRLREGARVEIITAGRANSSTPQAPTAPNAPPAATVAPFGAGSGPPQTDRPPWLDRLPPEQQQRFMNMSPAERQQFIDSMRERRRQQSGG